MTDEEFKNLREGDIVRGESSGLGYVVTHDAGNRKIGTRTIDISNPIEWTLVSKSYHVPEARRSAKD